MWGIQVGARKHKKEDSREARGGKWERGVDGVG